MWQLYSGTFACSFYGDFFVTLRMLPRELHLCVRPCALMRSTWKRNILCGSICGVDFRLLRTLEGSDTDDTGGIFMAFKEVSTCHPWCHHRQQKQESALPHKPQSVSAPRALFPNILKIYVR